MKKIFLGCIILVLAPHISAINLLDELLVTEPTINKAYYQLLPSVDEKNPDLFCIPSREPTSMSLEESFLEMIEGATQAYNFVETGTYLGDSTLKAARHFPFVHTIELSKDLCQKAHKRFAKKKNIKLYQGDSAAVLPSIIASLTDKTIFFLDAHFSMGTTARGEQNTPIVCELEKIKCSNYKNGIIIIDDIRMFYTPLKEVKNTFMEGYPTLNQIVDLILAINPSYQCAVIYDVLIAFPAQENISVSPLVQALTISRLYDGTNYDIKDVIAAELRIAHAQDKEKEALIDLAVRWIEKWSEGAGFSRHYDLWYGLILMVNEEYAKAQAYFREGKKRGLSDWRIDWYIEMAKAELFFSIR